MDSQIESAVKKMLESHPAWGWASQVKGAGLTTIGRIIGKTDIHRINTVSEMWAHFGFGLEADGTRQQAKQGEPEYTRQQSRGGEPGTLRR